MLKIMTKEELRKQDLIAELKLLEDEFGIIIYYDSIGNHTYQDLIQLRDMIKLSYKKEKKNVFKSQRN
jgi:hypothetical protein